MELIQDTKDKIRQKWAERKKLAITSNVIAWVSAGTAIATTVVCAIVAAKPPKPVTPIASVYYYALELLSYASSNQNPTIACQYIDGELVIDYGRAFDMGSASPEYKFVRLHCKNAFREVVASEETIAQLRITINDNPVAHEMSDLSAILSDDSVYTNDWALM